MSSGKGDLVSLNRDFNYSEKFWTNPSVAELEGLLNEDGIVDIGDINMKNVLINDFSYEINEILGLPLTSNLIDDTITIMEHKYHTRSLQHLIYDALDCEQRSYRDLKIDKPFLVVEYISTNKDMFSKCMSQLKTQAQGVLEANVGYAHRLRVVIMVKSKKARIRKVKYEVTILLNPEDIKEVN